MNNIYKDPFGKEYSSYKEYINSLDLDSDLICLHLWIGDRTPQNAEEEKIKKELDEIKAKGQIPEFYFD